MPPLQNAVCAHAKLASAKWWCWCATTSETPTQRPTSAVCRLPCREAVAVAVHLHINARFLPSIIPSSLVLAPHSANRASQNPACVLPLNPANTIAAGTATTAMAKRSRACPPVLALAALLLAAAAVRVDGGATGAAPAPAPSADCMDALVGLAGCLSYVEEGSTVATPDPSCCSGLKDVVRNEVACLCQVFQSGQNFGVSLNMTKALQLPAACQVKTPPFSKCHVSVPGVPTASPVPAPSSGAPFFGQSPSPSTPSGSSAGAATGSQTSTPAPAPARSGAAGLSAPPRTFLAAAALLMIYRVL